MRQKNLEKSAVIDYLRTTVRLTRRVSVHRFATRRRCDRRSVAAATTKDDQPPSAISGSPVTRTFGGLIETPTADVLAKDREFVTQVDNLKFCERG